MLCGEKTPKKIFWKGKNNALDTMKNVKDDRKKLKPESEIDLLNMKQFLMNLKITLKTYGKIRYSKKLQRIHPLN